MKAKVLKRFRDKYTGEFHEEGKVMTLSRERFDEILKVDRLVEEVSEPKKAKKTTTKAKS